MGCVVADTGPLIALAKIGWLELPGRLFGQAILPETVLRECREQARHADAQHIDAAIDRGNLTVVTDVPWLLTQARPLIDPGELAALALSLELQAPLLMDDLRGRKAALRFGVSVIGVCGLLLAAKHEGWIAHIAPLIDALRDQGYYIADRLKAQVLASADETP